jgi:hypothetical protein
VAEPAAGGRTASGSGPAKTGNSGKTGKAAPSRPAADSAPLRTRGRKRGTILLIVVLAVAAAAAGTGGYVLLGRHSPATPQAVTPASAPAAPSSPSGPPGRWKFIRSRATDPRRLTLAELYPKRFTITGNSGTRTIARAGRDCASAVLGSGLQSAVGKSHCNQVLRASYLSTDRKIMATIGVLNLVNATAAEQVGKATGAQEFIDQLPAAHGPTRNLKKGTGIEEADVKGHYLILIWAEFANLHAPSTAAKRTQLEHFASDLINGTANVSLTSRMVTGKRHAA